MSEWSVGLYPHTHSYTPRRKTLPLFALYINFRLPQNVLWSTVEKKRKENTITTKGVMLWSTRTNGMPNFAITSTWDDSKSNINSVFFSSDFIKMWLWLYHIKCGCVCGVWKPTLNWIFSESSLELCHSIKSHAIVVAVDVTCLFYVRIYVLRISMDLLPLH